MQGIVLCSWMFSLTKKNMIPSHLGGHGNTTHIDDGTLNYAIEKWGIKSFLDIGCGPGGMVKYAKSLGLVSAGVDGDSSLDFSNLDVTVHDFCTGPVKGDKRNYDLGWSTEFLEHVEERYQANYMKSFQQCKNVIATYAPRGKRGHHHVNCKDEAYWIGVFKEYGFSFGEIASKEIREASTMKREFMRNTGLVFKNEN